MVAQQRLARRIQRFLNYTERVTRWQYDHVEHAIEALRARRFTEGEDHMLMAEEPHILRAPTDLDGGDGCTAVLQKRLLATLAAE